MKDDIERAAGAIIDEANQDQMRDLGRLILELGPKAAAIAMVEASIKRSNGMVPDGERNALILTMAEYYEYISIELRQRAGELLQ